jgi:hypothetical protein
VHDRGGNQIKDPNLIWGNGDQAIDIFPLDDASDDTSTLQRPTLTYAVVTDTGTRIDGNLSNAAPSSSFDLEFFGNGLLPTQGDGEGEGEFYIGTATVTTDATGYVAFSVNFYNFAGGEIAATATGTAPDGFTSEFSPNVLAIFQNDLWGGGTPPTNVTVSGVSPSSGTTGGGTPVTITGTNFYTVQGVLFGDVPAAHWTVNSATSITVTSPPQVAGTVDVSVLSDGGPTPLSSADRFTYTAAAAPAVSSMSPNGGTTAGGNPVLITGSNFTGATDVWFGSVPASSFVINSDLQIVAVPPPQAAGSVDVTVATPSGTSTVSSADQFTYNEAPFPTVTGVSVATGTTAGGILVTVSGTGFTGATSVNFGPVTATSFSVLSDTALTVTVPPASAIGNVDVQVSRFDRTSSTSGADLFNYTGAPTPVVSGVTANSGDNLGGATVVLSGSGFTGASGVAFYSPGTGLSYPAFDFTVVSDGVILATTPAGVTGLTNVTVTNPGGTSSTSSGNQFTFTVAPAPTLSSLSTSSGSTGGGTQVVVTGTGLSNTTEVDFGSVAASDFIINSDTQLTVSAPAQAAGTIDITVVGLAGNTSLSSVSRFTYTAAPPPAITGLSVTSGTTGGGTSVTLTGTNFSGASAVLFGNVTATFTVNSDTSITAVSPPQVKGTVDIVVFTPTGNSAATSADRYSYNPAANPAVSSLATTSGSTAGGTLVTIVGSNFTGASAVTFGNVAAAYFTVNSDSSISAISPPQAQGAVHVQVTTPSGTSTATSADLFTYNNAPAPVLSSLNPATGTTPGGTAVTLLGSNFTGASSVRFGSLPAASFTVNSDTSITAISPPQAAGSVNVQVTTPSGTSGTLAFTYTNVTAPAPSITSVSPNTGNIAGGQVATITGSNFSGATSVSFGSVAATSFTIQSDTTLVATAPAQAAGAVYISVTTNNGTSPNSLADQFTYLSAPVPAVSSLGTSTGTTGGGVSVAISGSGFTGLTAVLFGSVPATFTFNSDTSITATAPAQAAGVVDVTVTNPSGTSAIVSADQFTYTPAPAPVLSSLSANSAPASGGNTITITGSNLLGTTAVNFGTTPAASFTINSDTQLTVVVPPAAVGTIDMQITTYSGVSAPSLAPSTASRFSFTLVAAPAVTTRTPTSGSTAGGTSVSLTGTNFTGASAVLFGSVPATSFTVNSDTSITATAPPQPVGSGPVDIFVTTPTGTSPAVAVDQFTYVAAAVPVVSGLSTNTGSTAGGTSVTITGSGFTSATSVTFAGVSASFTVNSDTSITAVSPPHTASPPPADVQVTTPSGTSAIVSADQFTYVAAPVPVVSGLTPATGSAAGGTVVTLTGSNFTGASAVSFGSTAVDSFTVVSDGVILTTAPPGTLTANVSVTTPSGTSSASSGNLYTWTAVVAPTVSAERVPGFDRRRHHRHDHGHRVPAVHGRFLRQPAGRQFHGRLRHLPHRRHPARDSGRGGRHRHDTGRRLGAG